MTTTSRPKCIPVDSYGTLIRLRMADLAREIFVDVCEPEPLPSDHPFWAHPKVVLTPHIASMTQPETAVDAVIDNICRHREGLPMIGLADRAPGY